MRVQNEMTECKDFSNLSLGDDRIPFWATQIVI